MSGSPGVSRDRGARFFAPLHRFYHVLDLRNLASKLLCRKTCEFRFLALGATRAKHGPDGFDVDDGATGGETRTCRISGLRSSFCFCFARAPVWDSS